MSVVIKINESSEYLSKFDIKKLYITIGAEKTMFYNFKRNLKGVGEPGANNKILAVSKRHPLVFEGTDFALVTTEVLASSRTVASLVDYVRKGLLNVLIDGAEATVDEIVNYGKA